MAYTVKDFQTKSALKAALAAGERVAVFQPGSFGPTVKDGWNGIEGPHYPKPHTWYAACEVEKGYIVKGTLR